MIKGKLNSMAHDLRNNLSTFLSTLGIELKSEPDFSHLPYYLKYYIYLLIIWELDPNILILLAYIEELGRELAVLRVSNYLYRLVLRGLPPGGW